MTGTGFHPIRGSGHVRGASQPDRAGHVASDLLTIGRGEEWLEQNKTPLIGWKCCMSLLSVRITGLDVGSTKRRGEI